MTTQAIPTTPPPVNPLNIPKKVAYGQLLGGDEGTRPPYQARLDDDLLRPEPVIHKARVTLIAECRHCHFTATIDADDDDHDGIEFRVWHHEQANPGHSIGYRTEIARWWE